MLWKGESFLLFVEFFKMNIRVVERECGPAERGLFVTGLADSHLASS